MPIAVSVHDLGVYMGWYGGVSYLGSFASPLMLLGMGSRFEIWDRARWNARKDERRELARKAMRERGDIARRRMPGNDA